MIPDLKALRAAAEAATPGPWEAGPLFKDIPGDFVVWAGRVGLPEESSRPPARDRTLNNRANIIVKLQAYRDLPQTTARTA